MESRHDLMRFRCCNPFGRSSWHRAKLSDLRPVLPWMIEKVPSLNLNQKICSKCRKELKNLPGTSSELSEEAIQVERSAENELSSELQNEPELTIGNNQTNFEPFIDKSVVLKSLNECLSHIGQSKIDNRRIHNSNYVQDMLENFVKCICEKVFGFSYDRKKEISLNQEDQFVQELKKKYQETTDKNLKCMILTLLPKDWTIDKIVEQLPGTSTYMARKSKELLKTEGILATTPRQRRSADTSTEEIVKDFYCNDEISRIMPGKKDFISMLIDGKRQHIQKRLILGNLREIYERFKDKNPEYKIGFSKFASLRPKNCILAGSKGTHAVCVCTIHQNMKLLIEGCKIGVLTANEDICISKYHMLLTLGKCNPPNIPCLLEECQQCPGYSRVRVILEATFEKYCIDNITYKQWTSTDRSQLETIVKPVDEFVDAVIGRLPVLSKHSFIAKQQNQYLQELKSSLQEDDIIVVMDFSENYSFVIQDEIQGYHWNTDQATVHPFGVYFRNKDTKELDSTNLIVISDCLKHNSTCVHLFQRKLIEFLRERLNFIRKIYYFSDGSAAQYKNRKNFYKLTLHQEEFQIDAEWNFFATAHGKSICDGLGGTIKRLAAKASLQRPLENQITTPYNLYEWVKENIKNMNFVFVPSEQYVEEIPLNLKLLPLTRKVHHIIPVSKGIVKAKYFSSSSHEFTHKFL